MPCLWAGKHQSTRTLNTDIATASLIRIRLCPSIVKINLPGGELQESQTSTYSTYHASSLGTSTCTSFFHLLNHHRPPPQVQVLHLSPLLLISLCSNQKDWTLCQRSSQIFAWRAEPGRSTLTPIVAEWYLLRLIDDLPLCLSGMVQLQPKV